MSDDDDYSAESLRKLSERTREERAAAEARDAAEAERRRQRDMEHAHASLCRAIGLNLVTKFSSLRDKMKAQAELGSSSLTAEIVNALHSSWLFTAATAMNPSYQTRSTYRNYDLFTWLGHNAYTALFTTEDAEKLKELVVSLPEYAEISATCTQYGYNMSFQSRHDRDEAGLFLTVSL